MVIINVFVTDISDTEQSIGVMLAENSESNVVYVVNHNYLKGTPDSDVKEVIQEKINTFIIPQPDNRREGLIQEIMGS